MKYFIRHANHLIPDYHFCVYLPNSNNDYQISESKGKISLTMPSLSSLPRSHNMLFYTHLFYLRRNSSTCPRKYIFPHSYRYKQVSCLFKFKYFQHSFKIRVVFNFKFTFQHENFESIKVCSGVFCFNFNEISQYGLLLILLKICIANLNKK